MSGEETSESWADASVRLGERLARIEALAAMLVRQTEPQEDR